MKFERLPLRFFAVLALSAAIASAKSTPVGIEQTVDAHFPTALTFTPINSGEARVIINIDADGQLADILVTGYTHQAFANEAVNLLRQWRYSAATINGIPVGTRQELRISFIATGRVVSMQAIDATDVLTQRILPAALLQRTCPPSELDQPIAVLQTVNPPHPGRAENAAQPSGTTMIDFYVDETGQIRMPVVTESTNQKYAEAAVGALSQWRFAAPTKHGKPIAVRVQQQFVFPADS